MEAIKLINSWTTTLMLLVTVGGVFMVTFWAIKMITASDEYDFKRAKENVKRTVIGVVIALSVSGLINVIQSLIGR